MQSQIERATLNIQAILNHALEQKPEQNALVIFDTDSPLSILLTEAYRRALPTAQFLDFAAVTPGDILGRIDSLHPGNLVVLLQSTNFRLNEFRFRIELFKRGLKTFECSHLNRMAGAEIDIYIDALAYDAQYYRPLGHAVKTCLDASRGTVVECGDRKLIYTSGMEPAKLNVGDYTGMVNIGGTYPIGEVFSEPTDLRAVNGEAFIFAYAGDDHLVRVVEPFLVTITHGVLSAPQGPAEFQAILEKIREDEEPLVREFGLGLNRAMNKSRNVRDITAFERQKGLHLSIGGKHTMYVKPGLGRKQGRYHVDVFVDASRILVDGATLYEQGEFRVPTAVAPLVA